MGLAKRIAEKKGSRPHPVEKFLEADEKVKWILPAQGGLHPFTMLFFAVFILVAVLVLDPRSWIMGVTITTVVFAVVALSLIHISEPTDQRGARMPSSA